MLHTLRATPETCFWGFFDGALRRRCVCVRGDLVRIETLTHQAGDAPDLRMDDGVKAVYDAIPIAIRGPGVHVMTGPIHVEGAEPGDTSRSACSRWSRGWPTAPTSRPGGATSTTSSARSASRSTASTRRPRLTLSRGEIVARDGQLLSRPGRGPLVLRQRQRG